MDVELYCTESPIQRSCILLNLLHRTIAIKSDHYTLNTDVFSNDGNCNDRSIRYFLVHPHQRNRT